MVSAMKASETQVGGTHYKDMGEFQPWDVLQHWLTPEEYRGYQKGVAIAYLARERGKGGDQDIRKAAHHLNKLVEVLDAAEARHAATAPVVIPPAPEYLPDIAARHAAGIDTLNAGPGIDVVAALAALDVVAANAADDGWIPWGGGECPVPADVLVKCKLKSGHVMIPVPAKSLMWRHLNDDGCNIIAYRVVRAA